MSPEPGSPQHAAPAPGGRLADFLLRRTPLGDVVRWVAGLRASVHTKLLTAFLLVTVLLVVMGGLSLHIIASVSRQAALLDEAHGRVDASRHIEHALAMQMNFTAMALILRDEAAIQNILRENNRFNNTLARLDQAAPDEEREIIRRIRTVQDDVLVVVADIANRVRDGKIDEAMRLHQTSGYPLYQQIEEFVGQVVAIEQDRMGRLRQSVAAARDRALILMAALAAVSIALALVFGFVISWTFILPVRAAHGFLNRVAGGNFATTIGVPNRDEFGGLAERMNAMSRELHRLHEDQAQAARQLRELNEQLRQASKAKSDFLARMSHELRTPMNAILGFTEMILDDIYGEIPAELRGPVTDIQACGQQLLRLINDVLDLSKIEAGRMELGLSEYSVQDVINTVRFSLRALAAEKGLEFVATVDDGIPVAVGDPKRITQCLVNLAGNAIKFTRQGRVEIRVERRADALVYRVSDTGIGIPPDQLDAIFTEFRQGDPAVAREFGGSGLGLSITKRFVEMHGGRLWVESAVGRGSTFSFSIPLRATEPVSR